MNPTDLYDEVALEFPATWPQNPDWVWVNVHDGIKPKIEVLTELLERFVRSQELIVVLHSEPREAFQVPMAAAASFIAKHILHCEIQASDPQFQNFLNVSVTGVAAASHRPREVTHSERAR